MGGNAFAQQQIPGPDQQVANPLQNRNIIWKGKKSTAFRDRSIIG
jgi:hypothetical protein